MVLVVVLVPSVGLGQARMFLGMGLVRTRGMSVACLCARVVVAMVSLGVCARCVCIILPALLVSAVLPTALPGLRARDCSNFGHSQTGSLG